MENKNHYQPIFEYIHLKTGLQLIESNEKALKISPKNVNFWKSRTRILYALSQLDEKYLE